MKNILHQTRELGWWRDAAWPAAPSATTRKHGTGLGLAESHRIVEMHGGRLTLENNPAGGARVTLELPADTGGSAR